MVEHWPQFVLAILAVFSVLHSLFYQTHENFLTVLIGVMFSQFILYSGGWYGP